MDILEFQDYSQERGQVVQNSWAKGLEVSGSSFYPQACSHPCRTMFSESGMS